MSSDKKRSNPQAAQTRRYLLEVWKAQGAVESFQNEWMDADAWVKTLTTNCTLHLPDGVKLTVQLLNEVVSKDPDLKDVVDLAQNEVGLYRHKYYGGPGGKKRIATYQWRTPGKPMHDPQPKSTRWSDRLYDPFWSERSVREMQPAKKKARTEPAAAAAAAANDDDDESRSSRAGATGESRPSIDPHAEVLPPDMVLTDNSDSDFDDSDDDSDSDFDSDDEKEDLFGTKELPPGTSMYYVSPEAKKLFAAQMWETAYDAIEDQIRTCSAVYNNQAPYESIVVGGDGGKLMSEYAIHKIRMQCHFIAKCLQIRLDHPTNELDWRGCCREGVKALKKNGNIMANNADTVMGWCRSFREERKFPNPSNGKAGLLPFFRPILMQLCTFKHMPRNV